MDKTAQLDTILYVADAFEYWGQRAQTLKEFAENYKNLEIDDVDPSDAASIIDGAHGDYQDVLERLALLNHDLENGEGIFEGMA